MLHLDIFKSQIKARLRFTAQTSRTRPILFNMVSLAKENILYFMTFGHQENN